MVSARYLHKDFFCMFCRDVVEIINHFNLHKLVYYTQSVNINLVPEFYNNLRLIGDGLWYTTHVAKRDLDFNSTILQEFLECRSSAYSFVCYSFFVEPFPKPFEHLSMNSIYEHFYHGPQPLRQEFLFLLMLYLPPTMPSPLLDAFSPSSLKA